MNDTHAPRVHHHPALEVRRCAYGWGVFTTRALDAGEVVECAPYLVLPAVAADALPLCNYVFWLSDDEKSALYGQRALSLGWGGLFNHDDAPNLDYAADTDAQLLEFITTRAVHAEEQLFLSYGADWWQVRDASGSSAPSMP